MKEKIIKALVDDGVPEAEALAYWETAKKALNGGHELTARGLARLTKEDFREHLPPIAAAIFYEESRPAGEPPKAPAEPEKKGGKWKPGKTYDAHECAKMYAADPENAGLVAYITERSKAYPDPGQLGGRKVPQPWVFAVNGTVDVAASAAHLAALFDGRIPPKTRMINGVPVIPVLPGEERAVREEYVDPLDPSSFLDTEMRSPRYGISVAGYSDDALSALQFVVKNALRGESPMNLANFVDQCRGKPIPDMFARFPVALAKWNALKPEDRPKAKRPFAPPDVAGEPVGAIDHAPLFESAPAVPAGAPSWFGVPSDQRFKNFKRRVAEMLSAEDIIQAGRESGVPIASVNTNLPTESLMHDICRVAYNAAKAGPFFASLVAAAPILAAEFRQEPVVLAIVAEQDARYADAIGNNLCGIDFKATCGAHNLARAGMFVSEATQVAVEAASIVLVIMSTDFYASDHARKTLDQARRAGKRIIPVMARAVDTQHLFPNTLCLPSDGKPMSKDIDTYAAEVAGEVRSCLR